MTPKPPYPLVVVGFDASPHAEDALALANILRRTLGARMIVAACAADPFIESTASSRHLDRVRQDAHDAISTARLLLEDDRELEFRVVHATSVGRGMHDVAEEVGADLVVVGTTHHRPVSELVAPSATHQVIQAAPCAVAVAPAGFAKHLHHPIKRVGVAAADSPEATVAAKQAAALAAAAGARLTLLHAHHPTLEAAPLAAVSYADPDYVETTRQLAEESLRRVAGELPAGVEAQRALLRGNPADAIVRASHELDLLFLGSRGYGPVRRVLLGSVSGRVVREAHCPLIVVPRAAALGHEPQRSGSDSVATPA